MNRIAPRAPRRTAVSYGAVVAAGALAATGLLGACGIAAQGATERTEATARAAAVSKTTPAAATGSVRAAATGSAPVSTNRSKVLTAKVAPRVHASTPAKVAPVAAVLKPGMKGAQVKTLQAQLLARGYWLAGADGTYGPTTTQAVMALQKAAHLSRDGVAGPATLAAVRKGVRPVAKSRRGHVLEIDKANQLLMVVDNGRVSKIINTSTGNGKSYINEISKTRGVANTPSGTFKIQRQIAGLRHADLGTLYWPKYFNGGIAIHGSPSIPGYAASHGCARVSNAAMDWLWSSGVAPVGTTVLVY